MIGVDAAGPRALRYGTMVDQVERLRVVFANGETAELGVEPWPAVDDEPGDFKGVVVRKLGALGRRHPRPLREEGHDLARIVRGLRDREGRHATGGSTSPGCSSAREGRWPW